MKKKNNNLALIGAGIALVGLYALTKKKEGPTEEETDEGALKIEVYDLDGNRVKENSPLPLIEGKTYTVVVTVRNLTTRAGSPIAADLLLDLYAQNTPWPEVTELLNILETHHFHAAEQRQFSYPLPIPLINTGVFGNIAAGWTLSGFIEARLFAPHYVDGDPVPGVQLAYGKKDLNIIPILYGSLDPYPLNGYSKSREGVVWSGALIDQDHKEWWDHEVQVTCYWRNDSPIPIKGHIEVFRTNPDGTVHSWPISYGQDQTINPGETVHVATTLYRIPAEGLYTFSFQLKTNGELLAVNRVRISVYAPIEYDGEFDW